MAKNIELEQLVINKLTQAQYDALAVKNPGELYFITDANPTQEVETQLSELSEKVPEPISTYESFPEATAENVGMRVVYTGETIKAPNIENEDGSVSTVFLDSYLTRGHTFMLVPVELSLDIDESITIYMWQDVNGAIPPISDDTSGKMLSNNGIAYEWMGVPETGLTKEEADQTYLPLTGGTLTGGVHAGVGSMSGTLASGQKPLFTATWTNPYSTKYSNFGLSATKDGLLIGQAQSLIGVIISQNGTLLPALTGAGQNIGTSGKEFRAVFVKYLSNGTKGSDGYASSYLTVPNAKGTIARVEDIDAAVGDISTALTAILGE